MDNEILKKELNKILAKKLKAKENLKKWRMNNPEKVKENVKKWRMNNPEKVKEISKRSYIKKKQKDLEIIKKSKEAGII